MNSYQRIKLQMRRDDNINDPMTFCEKCRKFVRTANYLIHQARCRGTQISQSRLSMSRHTDLNPMNYSNLRSNARMPRQQEETEEKIPCPFCGYGQTLAELDTHPNQCQHRDKQCSGCNGRYPNSLMQQHIVVCPARQIRQPNRQYQPNNFQINQRRDREYRNNYPESYQIARRRDQGMFQEESDGRLPQRHQPIFQIFEMMGNLRESSNMRIVGNRGNLGILINLLAGGDIHNAMNGLSQEEIKSFPITKYKIKQGEEQDLCTICYCNFEQNQQMLNLPCKHIYHPECISKWLQKNQKCPVCKQSVKGQNNRKPEQPQGRRQIRRYSFMM